MEPVEKEEGIVTLRNSQRGHKLDVELVYHQLKLLMKLLGKEKYDVSLWLTTDASMRSYNRMYRGQSKSTDILSFPFLTYSAPEVLTPESRRMSTMVQDLGDMMISIPYVQRQCQKDEKDFKKLGTTAWLGERGASGAMAKIFDVQERLPYLMIHGLIHLLGYDHENEHDYLKMVAKEEAVIKAFEKAMAVEGRRPRA